MLAKQVDKIELNKAVKKYLMIVIDKYELTNEDLQCMAGLSWYRMDTKFGLNLGYSDVFHTIWTYIAKDAYNDIVTNESEFDRVFDLWPYFESLLDGAGV